MGVLATNLWRWDFKITVSTKFFLGGSYPACYNILPQATSNGLKNGRVRREQEGYLEQPS